ncbi:hypothetical protein MJ585_06230 [Klebsiella pneumoniae]|nr:hypothetical protein MJ585_06230 [Klebsiella pneumoniae]
MIRDDASIKRLKLCDELRDQNEDIDRAISPSALTPTLS